MTIKLEAKEYPVVYHIIGKNVLCILMIFKDSFQYALPAIDFIQCDCKYFYIADYNRYGVHV